MTFLGKRNECFGMELLEPLQIYSGNGYGNDPNRLVVMPQVPKSHSVICGLDLKIFERMYVCESVADMKELYAAYARGNALRINWYSGPDPGFIMAS